VEGEGAEIAQTVVNAAVVGLVGLGLAWLARGHRRELKEELSEFRREVREDFRGLRQEFGEVRREISGVRKEISEVRSDVTRVALAVGAAPRAANT